jgi:hypothetical protein
VGVLPAVKKLDDLMSSNFLATPPWSAEYKRKSGVRNCSLDRRKEDVDRLVGRAEALVAKQEFGEGI